jgi:tetratricopeptide (TPR) repeat protein
MSVSPADAWGRARQLFDDQFEENGNSFTYRKSQKGEAIRVSAEERTRFIDEFNRNLRRATWGMYIGFAVVVGGILLLTLVEGADVSQAAIYAGIAVVVVPYLAYYYWAWGAPQRELAGRTPVAGERPPEEVRRLRFERMTYGQLASAGLGGLALPFIASSRHALFSGWNRLWFIFGGAMVALAAVQAFRKWRFEQDDGYRNINPPSHDEGRTAPGDDSAGQIEGQLWRYAPIAVIGLLVAFIALTPAGKQLAQKPPFWSIVMIGGGGWSLFAVVQGFRKGCIEPFARGFYNTYQRDAQPKRYWVSMGWNSIFGCLLFWFAFEISGQASTENLADRCFGEQQKYSPQETISACDQIIDKKAKMRGWSTADALVGRGIAYDAEKNPNRAIADYSEALRLEPDDYYAYLDRGIAYGQLDNRPSALSDFSAAIRLKRDPDALLDRGYVHGEMGDMQSAIADFTEVIRMRPNGALGYYYRALAYRRIGDTEHSTTDFEAAFRLDPRLCHGCRESDN